MNIAAPWVDRLAAGACNIRTDTHIYKQIYLHIHIHINMYIYTYI